MIGQHDGLIRLRCIFFTQNIQVLYIVGKLSEWGIRFCNQFQQILDIFRAVSMGMLQVNFLVEGIRHLANGDADLIFSLLFIFSILLICNGSRIFVRRLQNFVLPIPSFSSKFVQGNVFFQIVGYNSCCRCF